MYQPRSQSSLLPASEGWGEGNIFTLCVSPRLDWEGTLSQVWTGGTPSHVLTGVPHPRSGQGVPHPRSGWWGVPWGTPWPCLVPAIGIFFQQSLHFLSLVSEVVFCFREKIFFTLILSLLLEMKNFLNMDYDEIFTQELKLLIVELLGIQVMKMRNHLTLLCHCEYTLVCFYI